MSEERIKALLQRVDEAADPPVFHRVTAAEIRRRLRRRWLVRISLPVAAAAVALLATTLAVVCLRNQKPGPPPQQIASLETQVKQLQAQTEATLKLVREVLARDRQDRRLAALEAELASIPDPLRQLDAQVDKTVFLRIYQADRLYKELNQTESAIRAYKEVIQLFPKNRWADVARERLAEIEQHQINKSDSKGDTPCAPRNV